MNRRIRTEIIINAGKEKVWQVLTDFKSYGKWNPFLVSVEGAPVAGTRLVNTMVNKGKPMTFKPKVMKAEDGRGFAWLGHLWVKGIFDGYHYFEIEELGPQQVKLVHGENFSGILSGWIYYKMGEEIFANFVRMNQALKLVAERN